MAKNKEQLGVGIDTQCSICGQIFANKRGRANHDRKHTGAAKLSGARGGATKKALGLYIGEKNPNFGVKSRPWLEGENSPLRQWHKENPDFGARQRGDANPVHKAKHLYENPEYVEKITRGIREHAEQKRGSSYEEVYGEDKAAEYKQKLRDASPERLAKSGRKETKPERIIREILEKLEIPFQQEAPIGPYTVDFFLQQYNIVIQADGDYWHANPSIYKELSRIQKTRRRIDASCDSFLGARGYRVLRFWESDLISNPEKCQKTLQEYFNVG